MTANSLPEHFKPQQSGRPRALDLFCCAGGMAKGLHDAGFDVYGVDKDPQPHYPYTFIQADALDFLRFPLIGFSYAHASPPCQVYGDLKTKVEADAYPKLIEPVRELLIASGLPYTIENVEGAPLIDPVKLCGAGLTSPGGGFSGHFAFYSLRVIRHRLFESNLRLHGTFCPSRHPLVFTHDKRKAHHGKLDQNESYVQVTGGGNCSIANAREAMGIDWMNKHELNEAIPPAYGEFIGRQVIRQLQLEKAA